MYANTPLPDNDGFIIKCLMHKSIKSRGEMVTHVTQRLRKAIIKNASNQKLADNDLAFPGNPSSPMVPLKFYRHGYPIVKTMAPQLVLRAEKESGKKLPSNFVRQMGMSKHVSNQ